MRLALGLDGTIIAPASHTHPVVNATPKPLTALRSRPRAIARTPKLRVTLRVSTEFEGETTLFTHEADTLSRFDAEQQGRALAKKAKYRYVELVSITAIE